MVTPLTRADPHAPEYYRFRRWAIAWYGLWNAVAVLFCLLLVALAGWFLIGAGLVGWLLLAGFALWTVYALAVYLALYTPVVVRDDGFSVRTLWRWSVVPWSDVERMRYATFPFHAVYVRGGSLFHRAFPASVLLRRGGLVALMIGLEHRSRLFWEIWRRASRAQSRSIPLEGARPPPDLVL